MDSISTLNQIAPSSSASSCLVIKCVVYYNDIVSYQKYMLKQILMTKVELITRCLHVYENDIVSYQKYMLKQKLATKVELITRVYFENTLRRFSIPWEGALLFQMNDLRARIINFFNFRYDDDLSFLYRDEDREFVTLVDNNDWSEAIRQNMNPLRIYVRLNSNSGSRSRSTSSDVGEIPEPISDPRNSPVLISRHPNFPFVDLNDTPSWESELETQVLTPTLDLLANHGLPGSSGDPIPPIDNVSDFPPASSILVSQENVGGRTNKDGETDSLHGRSGDSVPIDRKEPAEQSDTTIDLPVTGHNADSVPVPQEMPTAVSCLANDSTAVLKRKHHMLEDAGDDL